MGGRGVPPAENLLSNSSRFSPPNSENRHPFLIAKAPRNHFPLHGTDLMAFVQTNYLENVREVSFTINDNLAKLLKFTIIRSYTDMCSGPFRRTQQVLNLCFKHMNVRLKCSKNHWEALPETTSFVFAIPERFLLSCWGVKFVQNLSSCFHKPPRGSTKPFKKL